MISESEHSLAEQIEEYSNYLDRNAPNIQVDFPLNNFVEKLKEIKEREIAGTSIPDVLSPLVDEGINKFGTDIVGAYSKLLVLSLINQYPININNSIVSDNIKKLYPATFKRIQTWILRTPNDVYVTERRLFARDVRLAALLSVPISASRLMDLYAFLPSTFYRYMGYPENLKALAFVVSKLHGLEPFFQIHIDERDTSELYDNGFNIAYRNVAEMLLLYPRHKGSIATSWTLDPALDEINPKIAFSRQNQVANGAFLKREGPNDTATQFALKKSASRRELFESGNYLPCDYTVVWPRKNLLNWSKRYN